MEGGRDRGIEKEREVESRREGRRGNYGRERGRGEVGREGGREREREGT